MELHAEESLRHDIDAICRSVASIGRRAERSLHDCMTALAEQDRSLAYAVILRDLFIDQNEQEIDQLCLQFIIRQQPVAADLRFAYCTFKVSLEIERVGDYAEAIARNVLRLSQPVPKPVGGALGEIARLAISMFHDAVQAFVERDAGKAARTIEIEETVDQLRLQFTRGLVDQLRGQLIAADAFDPLITIAKRLERVSDQARNICRETQYMVSGTFSKHPGADQFRVLFVDETDACLVHLAQAASYSLKLDGFVFGGAGMNLGRVDSGTVEFLESQGMQVSAATSRAIGQVRDIDHHHIIIGLKRGLQHRIHGLSRKTVYLEWPVDDPAAGSETGEERRAAYARAFGELRTHLSDLVRAVLGSDNNSRGETHDS